MILNKIGKEDNDLTYESYNSDEKKFETTIDISDSYLVMELVSNFYRNPIGSIIREITSNCFDAHLKDENEDDAVVIKIGYDFENNNYFIEFIDKGTGLSEDQMENTYAKWFKSDKRDSNTFIGGFGLGSKSPFSYSEIFYITTIVDGVTYEYVNFKKQPNEKGIREFELSQINKYFTNKRNGTTIKIDLLKDADLSKFCYEIRNQLSYFNNVFLDVSDSMFSDYSYNLKNFNEEKILEYQTFAFRACKNNSNYTIREESNIFILLGSVKYEINLNEMPELKCTLPFGLRFNIGDLSVVPNREDIHYSENNKKVIREKFNLFKKELNKLIVSQNTLEFTNYREYKRSNSITLKVGSELYYKIFSSVQLNNLSNVLQEVNKTFVPLKNYKYKEINIDVLSVFYDYNNFNGLIGSKVVVLSRGFTNMMEYFYGGSFTVNKNSKSRTKINIYNAFDRYIGYTFRPKVRKEQRECLIRESNGLDNFLTDNLHDYKSYEITLKDGTKTTVKSRRVPKLGKAIALYNMIKYFKSIITFSNSDFMVITDEMKQEYQEMLDSKNTALMRKRNKEIVLYEYDFRYSCFRKEITKIGKLEKYKFFIYKIKDMDKTANKKIIVNGKIIETSSVESLIRYANEKINKKKIMFIYIELSKSEFEKLRRESLENMMSVDEFLVTDFAKKSIFKSIVITQLRKKFDFTQNTLFNDRLILKLSQYYDNYFKIIRNYTNSISKFDELHHIFDSHALLKQYPSVMNSDLVFYTNLLNEIVNITKANPILRYLSDYTPRDLAIPLLKKTKHIDYPESRHAIEIRERAISYNKKFLIYLT